MVNGEQMKAVTICDLPFTIYQFGDHSIDNV